ncbi:hypothetical protein ACHAXH_003558 [Discostella pseudostelligera]|jgi:hypothetical protein
MAKALTMATPLVISLLLLPLLPCQSIHLDIHIPLPDGCLKYHALLANRLLRQASRRTFGGGTTAADDDDMPMPTEEVNLFSLHTPHITLYLADFDLEVSEISGSNNNEAGALPLNDTKVTAFISEISSINFTEIILSTSMECTITYSSNDAPDTYYIINGAYTMLPIAKNPCLQTLSDTILQYMKSYLRHPVVVPNWVAELPEPSRSASIYRCREYGSPNVLEGFDPHVTVGYDPSSLRLGPLQNERSATYSPVIDNIEGISLNNSNNNRANDDLKWRIDAMQQWNDLYRQALSSGNCADEVQGIALGKVGVGGTVLANTRMGYWDIGPPPGDQNMMLARHFAIMQME